MSESPTLAELDTELDRLAAMLIAARPDAAFRSVQERREHYRRHRVLAALRRVHAKLADVEHGSLR